MIEPLKCAQAAGILAIAPFATIMVIMADILRSPTGCTRACVEDFLMPWEPLAFLIVGAAQIFLLALSFRKTEGDKADDALRKIRLGKRPSDRKISEYDREVLRKLRMERGVTFEDRPADDPVKLQDAATKKAADEYVDELKSAAAQIPRRRGVAA